MILTDWPYFYPYLTIEKLFAPKQENKPGRYEWDSRNRTPTQEKGTALAEANHRMTRATTPESDSPAQKRKGTPGTGSPGRSGVKKCTEKTLESVGRIHNRS